MTSAPIRSCVGCGRKAPQSELIRFVADGGRLVPGAGRPGRGAYTCRRLACFERALARRAFNRTLRQTVHVEQALTSLAAFRSWPAEPARGRLTPLAAPPQERERTLSGLYT